MKYLLALLGCYSIALSLWLGTETAFWLGSVLGSLFLFVACVVAVGEMLGGRK